MEDVTKINFPNNHYISEQSLKVSGICLQSQEFDILYRKYMVKYEKIFPSLYKETQGMQHLDYPPLHQDALTTQNHQRNKK